jgi:predicted helicase
LKQYDVFGTRAKKYAELSSGSSKAFAWRTVTPASPFYVFLPQDEDVRIEYLRYPSIKQAMPVNVLGFQTHRDDFAVAFDRETIVSRCEALRDTHLKDSEIKAHFGLTDSQGWNVHEARKALRDDERWKRHIIRCLYRPFDIRWCYFSTAIMDRPRRELLDHVAGKKNLCLLVPRQISFLPWQHTGVSNMVAESCLVSTKTKEQNYNFPLYLYPDSNSLTWMCG